MPKRPAIGWEGRGESMSTDESVTGRVLGAVDADAADLLRGYLLEPIASVDLLVDQLEIYRKQLEAKVDEGAVFDLELAEQLARSCGRLLTSIDDTAPLEDRMLIQAAVRYFTAAEDADDDTESLIGFDDDAAVVEAVAVALHRAEVLEDESI